MSISEQTREKTIRELLFHELIFIAGLHGAGGDRLCSSTVQSAARRGDAADESRMQ